MRTIVDLPEPERDQLDAQCRHLGLSRAAAIREALRLWLNQQQRAAISEITWIEVLVGCRVGESAAVETWLESFLKLPLDHSLSRETVLLRQRHGLKVPDAIILATATDSMPPSCCHASWLDLTEILQG